MGVAERVVEGEGGVGLHVVTSAEGEEAPVLLVHGLASNAHLWDGVLSELAAQGHPVAAVDQRGHGRSTKPDDGYDFGTLCLDLLAVIGALGWDAPVVAGQSWGGNVVLELAIRHPSAVSGLVLVDGGTLELSAQFADWPTAEAALAPPHLEGRSAVEFEGWIRTAHPDWPEAGIQGTLANMEVRPDGTIRPWLSRENHLRILRHLWEHRPSQRYADVKAPVRLVMAEDPSNQRWMAGKRNAVAQALAALPRAEAIWIKGDHDLHAEHPAEVARVIHTLAP